jgi:signal transduction histidine kinase
MGVMGSTTLRAHGDAFTRDLTRVQAADRPDPSRAGVFAVFDGDGANAPFLGMVTPQEIARHPRRTFANLLSGERAHTVLDDATPETALARMDATGATVLAVLDRRGRFVGAVTRESLSYYLLARERSLVAEMGSREAQLRAILRTLPDTLLRVDVDGQPLDLVRRDAAVNDDGVWEPASGTRPVGKQVYEGFPAEVRATLLEAVQQSVTSGTPAVVPFRLNDGAASREYEARVVRWGERAALIVSNDITEVHTLRARMELADRMIALGTLAAAVAHEINNPLTYVLLNLKMLQQRFGESGARAGLPGEPGPNLEGMREGLERIQAAVTDLLGIARPSEAVRGRVDVRETVASSMRLATYAVKYRARLTCDCGDVPVVEANRGALGQVFLNLLLNAAHSIGEGAVDDNEIHVVTRTDAAGRAVVEIRDTGCGMTDEVRARIFEPFFTTRPERGGTGLGLSVCQSIVSAMGGVIEVESAVGRGSRFSVVLPSAGAAPGE